MLKQEAMTGVSEIPLNKKLYHKLFPLGAPMSKLRISNISVYSMTRPYVADTIVKYIASLQGVCPKSMTVTDAFSNVGGASLAFAKIFGKVQCCELEPLHCSMLHDNLKAYGVKAHIYCGDYMYLMDKLKQDIVFLDPPWGGPSYKNYNKIRLLICGGTVHIGTVIRHLIQENLAVYVVLLLPPNLDTDDLIKHTGPLTVKCIRPVGDKLSIAVFSRG